MRGSGGVGASTLLVVTVVDLHVLLDAEQTFPYRAVTEISLAGVRPSGNPDETPMDRVDTPMSAMF